MSIISCSRRVTESLVLSMMLRNILRTSRWLSRRKINNFIPVVIQHCTAGTLRSNYKPANICKFSSSVSSTSAEIDPLIFEEICNETLESLCDHFEEIVEQSPNLKGADVTYSDGVLTVALGSTYGTYVINRQSPNKQIWLSSPVSGPKRYDLILKDNGYWVYKHNGVTLHKLLQDEISKIVPVTVDFRNCSHSLV